MVDIPTYYARSPASCFSILQWGTKLIGLVAVDASTNSTNDKSLSKDARFDAQQDKALITGKGTASVATIRHFFSEEGYRAAGIDRDLLQHAVTRAFSDKMVKSVRISVCPLKRTLVSNLEELNFKVGESDGKLGPFGWEWRWHVLDRARWEKDVAAERSG
jgi:hypothetical protein